MKTPTVILSKKYDHYAIAVPPGSYIGFYLYREGRCTFTQMMFIRHCGIFTLRDHERKVFYRTRLINIPNNDGEYSHGHFARYTVDVEKDWVIELDFHSAAKDGIPEQTLKWIDFPEEVTVGFNMVERDRGDYVTKQYDG